MLRKIFQYAIAQPMNKVDKINTNRTTDKTTDGLLSLSGTLLPLAQKLLGNKGFIEVDILTQWEKIVGTELARYSFPQKIEFGREKNNGILHLCVPSGAFALELQHKSKLIIDKINTYFGYNAVSKIKIIQNQGLIPEQPASFTPPPPTINLTAEQEKEIKELTKDISNPDLKNILIKLGKNVFNQKTQKREKNETGKTD